MTQPSGDPAFRVTDRGRVELTEELMAHEPEAYFREQERRTIEAMHNLNLATDDPSGYYDVLLESRYNLFPGDNTPGAAADASHGWTDEMADNILAALREAGIPEEDLFRDDTYYESEKVGVVVGFKTPSYNEDEQWTPDGVISNVDGKLVRTVQDDHNFTYNRATGITTDRRN